MLRRLLAAAFLVLLGIALLLLAWPQLVGLQRTAGFAQAVSLRGGAVAASVVLVVLLGIIGALAVPVRKFVASCAVLLLVFCLLNLAVLSTRGFGGVTDDDGNADGNANGVTVLSWNTLGDAPGAEAIAALAIDTSADIVTLPETTAETATGVAEIMGRAGRPMQVLTEAFDQISKARSTSLLISTELGPYAIDDGVGNSTVLPTIVARPTTGPGPTIISVHLVAPIPGELHNWNTDLDWIADACAGDNVIMAGDFNSTLDHFGGLSRADGATIGTCRDAASASDSAAVGTWPTSVPALLSSPIDHVMQTPNWRVAGMRVIETHDNYGSDHRPVVADLVAEPQPN